MMHDRKRGADPPKNASGITSGIKVHGDESMRRWLRPGNDPLVAAAAAILSNGGFG